MELEKFKFWCQKALPAVYDDSLSYYELLCKIADTLNAVIVLVNNNDNAVLELRQIVEELQKEIALYSGKVDNFISDFDYDRIIAALDKYVKQIFFGLTADGYFVAYVPSTWNDITFDTGAVYSNKNTYGKLILKY